ncbi:MAG: hypothetical protein KAT91_01045 [Candidatus Aenigmarchaeota archaeon]|nr:hypothetical protein [Candidatus Aenigmarchaeota archaeon]MCK5474592.1 hypothetical protein [Candidatus Aenigmarchaeota archaeon]
MADLIVKSKVREYAKSKGVSFSAEADDVLDKVVAGLLDRAGERAKANNRTTIKARDL